MRYTVMTNFTPIPFTYQQLVEIMEMAGGAGSWRGTGGMATKLSAARIATEAGCDMVITNGARTENLYGIVAGEDIGTRFIAPR